MQIPPDVLSALIGACSALLVIALRDGALRAASERHSSRRKLLQLRIEHAYAPVEFLVHRLLHTDDPQRKEVYTRDIELILRQHSHLLSEQVTSALYTLLDDHEAGAALLQPHFFDEFAALKQQFYASWYGVQRPVILTRPGWLRALVPQRKEHSLGAVQRLRR